MSLSPSLRRKQHELRRLLRQTDECLKKFRHIKASLAEALVALHQPPRTLIPLEPTDYSANSETQWSIPSHHTTNSPC